MLVNKVQNLTGVTDFVICLPASELSLSNVGNLINKFIINLSSDFIIWIIDSEVVNIKNWKWKYINKILKD